MKKKITSIFALLALTVALKAQTNTLARVGINTSVPAATLDISASAADLSRTDGFIAPRLTADQLQKKDALYTASQDATMVYVTALLTSTTTDKTVNISSIGYYYFDKTQGTGGRWMKIANPSGTTAYQEPWNVQGGTVLASSNNEAIYQNNAVAIKKQVGITGTDLDVAGSIRGAGAANTSVGLNSLAYGVSSVANANGTVAIGPNSNASRTNSYALGNNAKTGFAADGTTATSGGDHSYAIGENSLTGANNAYALGKGAKALSPGSVAMGNDAPTVYANAKNGFALGNGAVVGDGSMQSDHSYAIGEGATAISTNSYSIGKNAKANAVSSYSIGEGAQNNTANGVVLGAYNEKNASTDTDYLLQVANGTNSTRKNAVTVIKSTGNVGVNTTSPKSKLHTNSTTKGGAFSLTDTSEGIGKVLTSDANGNATWTPFALPVIKGVNGAGLNVPFVPNSSYKNTGSYIDLPPGKWMVTCTQLSSPQGPYLTANDWIFLRTTFSDQSGLAVGDVATQSTDISETPTLASFTIQGLTNAGVDGNSVQYQRMSISNNQLIINNTSGAVKRYFYIIGNSIVGGAQDSNKYLRVFGGNWSENLLSAIQISN